MKLLVLTSFAFIFFCFFAQAQESFSGAQLNGYSTDLDQLETAEFGSLETTEIPPIGQFQRSNVRVLQWMSAYMGGLLAYLNTQEEVNPLVIQKYQELKVQVDLAIQTKSQLDAIDIDSKINKIASVPVIEAWSEEISNISRQLGELFINSFERHMIDTNGVIEADTAKKFANAYMSRRIPFESEDLALLEQQTNFSNYDVLICNPQAVIEVAKSGYISKHDNFWYDIIPDEKLRLDEIYGAQGNANPILKSRYASQKVVIDALLDDYYLWVSSLDAAPPADEISKRDAIILNQEGKRLGSLIELIENGSTAKQHVLYPKLQACKAALDHLASTAKIADVKNVVLAMEPFEKEWIKIWEIAKGIDSDENKTAAIAALGLPDFFYDVYARLNYSEEVYGIRGVDPDGGVAENIAEIYKRYCQSLAGVLPAELFNYEYLWVEKAQIAANESAADVFVLFPNETFDRIKTLSSAARKRILVYKGDLLDTPDKFFAVLAQTEEHPDYVIARYTANKAAIDAKYAELIQWHNAQPAEQ